MSSSEVPLPFGLEATDLLPPVAILTALAIPLSPSSWGRASKRGRSAIGKWSDISSLISAVLIVGVWAMYPLQGSYQAIAPSSTSIFDEKDRVTAKSLGHYGWATLIAGTAFCLEIFHVISHRILVSSPFPFSGHPTSAALEDDLNGTVTKNNKRRIRRTTNEFRLWTLSHLHDSECMLAVYAILFSVYGMMFYSGGRYSIVHCDPFVKAFHRPVNAVRFVEWAIASPILMALTGRSIPRLPGSDLSDPQGEELSNLVRPGLVVTAMYMWLTWLAQVVLDFQWRVILITVAFFCYALASIDQCTAWLRDTDVSAPTAKASVYLLLFQVVFFGCYGVVFVFGFCGLLDPIKEQTTFTIWDVTIKVAVSAALMSMRHATLWEETLKAKTQYATAAHNLSRLVDTANAPIFAVDLEQKVTLWNKKLAELTGRSADEVIGSPLSDLLCPDCREHVMGVLDRCNVENPTTGQFHCDFASVCEDAEDSGEDDRRSGCQQTVQKISIIMTGTIRHNSENEFVGIVGVGQDLTEVTRYRDIEEKKRQLMAMVSHELKSPLHGIIGLTALLSKAELDTKRSQQLDMVKSCATRLLDLVSNIMEMSVLRKGSVGGGGVETGVGGSKPFARDPVEIGAIISEVCTLVKNAVDKSNRPLLSPDVKLLNQVSCSHLPIVIGDAYKITQVFYNIITNACKFCSAGRIVVSARVNSTKETLNVCVDDTGVGIGPDAVKRIFEPFEQEQLTEQRSFGGIGLGLAIARDVVQKHGGDISVRSVPGEGSTFTISFPVTPEAVAAVSDSERLYAQFDKKMNGVASNDKKASGLMGEEGRQGRHSNDISLGAMLNEGPNRNTDGLPKPVILSVDDDLVNQEVIKSALSDKYEIHIAMDGFEALEYFGSRSKLPDLVLLDVMMPGMTGFEVLNTIRRTNHISPSALPIIMLSAIEPVEQSIIQSLNSGSNDYVSKPFNVSILRARVHTAMQIKRLHYVELEKKQFSRLLHEIMPRHIVQRLISGESVISERHDSVCILFSDIVGWTSIAEELPTAQLIAILNNLFSKFDELTEKYNVFKAETIGDAYIVAAGHDDNHADHTHRVVNFGLAMIEAAKSMTMPSGLQLQLRVGVHTGPAYTGVIGNKVPKYTFFGDTVNMSSRMESTGIAGCIQLSTAARQALEMEKFYASGSLNVEQWLKGKGATIVDRGEIGIKNKGMMKTHIIFPSGVAPTMKALARTSSKTHNSMEAPARAAAEACGNDFGAGAESAAREEVENAIALAKKKADDALQEAKEALTQKQHMEVELRGELESLRVDFQNIQASERKSREKCEKLQRALAQTRSLLGSSEGVAPPVASGNAPSGAERQRRRPSYRRTSSGLDKSNSSSFGGSSRASFTDAIIEGATANTFETINSEIEELRLQLLVTTKALHRARADLLAKEDQIDEMELEKQSIMHSTSLDCFALAGNDDLAISSIHTSMRHARRRSSFAQRTHELLNSMQIDEGLE